MKQLRRLLKFISFVIFCLITDINSAQVNIAATNYTFGPVGGNNVWHNVGGNNRLTSQMLMNHLNGMPVADTLRELARMLLAQIPAAGGIGLVGPHNIGGVGGNTNAAYTTAIKVGGGHNCDDIFLACDELKEHMLIHGHLGYFPFMKNNENLSRVETFIARGIFNIPFNIASRITNDQRRHARDIFSQRQLPSPQTRNPGAFPHGYNITNDVIHLSPNILADTELPRMFEIDPERRGWPYHPNLKSIANGLINNLLSGNNVVNVQVNPVNGNRFTLDVTYNFANCIPGVTETQNIGYKMDGTFTNTVKIVVQVNRGKLSIITMYPIG